MSSISPAASIKTGLPDYFLLGLLIFILAQIAQLLLPFSGSLLLSMVIGLIFYPLHARLGRYLPKRSSTARALISDGIVLLFFIVPLVLLVWSLVNEAESVAPTLKQWRATMGNLRTGGADSIAPVHTVSQWLRLNVGIQPDQFQEKISGMADNLVEVISVSGASFAKNSLGVVMDLVVMVFTLFFIFRDGPKMAQRFQAYIPLRTGLKAHISEKIENTIVGVLKGVFLTSLIQGATASVGYLLAGVPAVILLGFLTAIAGLVPSIGTALVWLPLSIFYLATHAYMKGCFILAWGVLVIGLLDNLLRPYLISEKAELPFLALFFALLGGIEAWGIKGIVLGPILMSILPVLLEAYRQRYLTEAETAPLHK